MRNVKLIDRGELFGAGPQSDFSDEEFDVAADCIDALVERILLRVDQLNNENRALSFFLTETWRLRLLTGNKTALDEFAIDTAPIMRRIHENTHQIGNILSGLRIDAELGCHLRAD